MDSRMEDILGLVPQEVIGIEEENLHKLLNEVRNEIEENEMVHGIPLKVPRYLCYQGVLLLLSFIDMLSSAH